MHCLGVRVLLTGTGLKAFAEKWEDCNKHELLGLIWRVTVEELPAKRQGRHSVAGRRSTTKSHRSCRPNPTTEANGIPLTTAVSECV